MATGAWHNRRAGTDRSDYVTSSVRELAVPFVHFSSGIGRWFSRQSGWLFRGRSTDAENRRLRDENRQLKDEIARLKEADATAIRLRAAVGFAEQPPTRKIAADVVSVRPISGFETLVINRGSRSGIHLHSVVACPMGLVGQVSDAGPNTCVVQLLTEANSAAGARVQRPESRAVGICKGDGGPLLSLAYLNQDSDVKLNDIIVSSGLGGAKGVYPKGIVMGRVVSVTPDASGSTKNVRVKPVVDFNKLEEVFVLP